VARTRPLFFVNRPDEGRLPIGIRVEVDEPRTLRYDWCDSMPAAHPTTTVKRVK
jgi:hypothetical protein